MVENIFLRKGSGIVVSWIARIVWSACILASVGIRILSLHLLQQAYQILCPVQLCYPLPQLNPESLHFILNQGMSLGSYASLAVGLEWIFCLGWWALGFLLAWRRPLEPLAGVIILFSATIPASAPIEAMRLATPSFAPVIAIVTFLNSASLLWFLGLFPNGIWNPAWSKYIAYSFTFYYFVFTLIVPSTLQNELLLQQTGIINVIALAVGLGFQIYRFFWRSNDENKKQVLWFLLGLTLIAANYLVGSILLLVGSVGIALLAMIVVYILGETMIPVALGIAVFRYRLFAIDGIVNRALVYTGLTAGVVGIYALITTLFNFLIPKQGGYWGSLIAATIVALIFQPMRYALQRGVNHMFYGDRAEPYKALSKLGDRLESALTPEEMLPTIVTSISEILKLPYASIELRHADGSFQKRAEVGSNQTAPVLFPLYYQGEQIGRLLVTARSGERDLAEADRRLLTDLARQAGIAVHAVKLADDLQQIREQLVMTREEERQRIRRDLHDGLGPSLAAILMLADSAKGKIRNSPEKAVILLVELIGQANAAVEDMRHLIRALRPPILDDLGFISAVQALAITFTQSGLTVLVKADAEFQSLPAAVEVAAMRIIQEALTNVAKHARATTAIVHLSQSSVLKIQVEDDGQGMGLFRQSNGIGLVSMRTRAEELGGTLVIQPRQPAGTIIEARLPLRRNDAAYPVIDR